MSAFASSSKPPPSSSSSAASNVMSSEAVEKTHYLLQQLQAVTDQLPASWNVRTWAEFFDGLKMPQNSDICIDRIKQNTSYYQSNYVVIFIIVFIAMSLFTLPVILAASGCWYLYTQRQDLLKPHLPNKAQQVQAGGVAIVAVALLSFSIIRLLKAVLVAGIISLIHASLRSRKLSMKVGNVVENVQGAIDMVKGMFASSPQGNPHK